MLEEEMQRVQESVLCQWEIDMWKSRANDAQSHAGGNHNGQAAFARQMSPSLCLHTMRMYRLSHTYFYAVMWMPNRITHCRQIKICFFLEAEKKRHKTVEVFEDISESR